jgi:hypothetical protein
VSGSFHGKTALAPPFAGEPPDIRGSSDGWCSEQANGEGVKVNGCTGDRIRCALANPLSDDRAIDPMRELAELLREVGLEPQSGGGAVTFAGCDPIVGSPLPFATMAAVTLMAKAVSVAELWRFRGGQSQDLSVNLGKALHRLCPFYDKNGNC